MKIAITKVTITIRKLKISLGELKSILRKFKNPIRKYQCDNNIENKLQSTVSNNIIKKFTIQGPKKKENHKTKMLKILNFHLKRKKERNNNTNKYFYFYF